jgi:hypothetical protein
MCTSLSRKKAAKIGICAFAIGIFLRKDQVLLLAGHERSSSADVGKKHVSSSFTILPVSFCNCEQYCTAIPPSMCYLVNVSLSSDRSTTGH